LKGPVVPNFAMEKDRYFVKSQTWPPSYSLDENAQNGKTWRSFRNLCGNEDSR